MTDYLSDGCIYIIHLHYQQKCSNEAFQALWIEVYLAKNRNVIRGVVYRQHNSPEHFQEYLDELIEKVSASGKQIFLMGDTNLNLISFYNCKYVQNLILSLQNLNLTPTRVHNNSITHLLKISLLVLSGR